MRYFGGKQRLLPKLVPVIQAEIDRSGAQTYWEPFVGGASVFSAVRCPVKIASDVNEALSTLYTALQQGWEPPDTLSEDAYVCIKGIRDPKDPVTAFAGFGVSFGGKWFGGYCRAKQAGQNYVRAAKNGLLRKRAGFGNATFLHSSYADFSPSEPAVIYCDPPYAGTTPYAGAPKWDPKAFWEWAKNIAKEGHTVLVSEYSHPDGTEPDCIWPVKTDMHGVGRTDGRSEKLWILRSKPY